MAVAASYCHSMSFSFYTNIYQIYKLPGIMVRHTILKIHMMAHILLSMLEKYATLMLQSVTVQK